MTQHSVSKRAVAIGGGTGLPTVLQCLSSLGYDTTAVVTMADDGGSTGVLRAELGILPPGDIRNCLVALSKDPTGPLAELFQYRFDKGTGLKGHALGNLIIAALSDIHGGFAGGIEAAEELLGATGRVLPSTVQDVVLHAMDASGSPIAGQSNIATSTAPVARVTMEPAAPPAYLPALEAIRAADVIVIGPGSLYTSLIPNFLVGGIVKALTESSGTCIYICNVANQRGETQGMDAAQHVEALVAHGLEGVLDTVLIHDSATNIVSPDAPALCDDGSSVEFVRAGSDQVARIQALGVRVVSGDLVDAGSPLRHDPAKLCSLLREVV